MAVNTTTLAGILKASGTANKNATALGLSPVNKTSIPQSISKTPAAKAPATLIPSNLEAAGRGGGATPIKPNAQQTLDLINKKATVDTNAQGPLKSGYVTASQAQASANAAAGIKPATTSTGVIVPSPAGVNTNTLEGILEASGQIPDLTGGSNAGGNTGGGGSAGGGGTGGGNTGNQAAGDVNEGAQAAAGSGVDAQAALDAAIARLLGVDWIDFQGNRAAELRRLQNLRNQLYGDVDTGMTGAVQRQQQMDSQARRRLAAGRAAAGMLQGGAYAGGQRGLGSVQQAEQAFNLQELQRPFMENVASDRLAEFGLSFDPTGRRFNLSDFGAPGADQDMMRNWSQQTAAGRSAAARARAAAIAQLAQQGITI